MERLVTYGSTNVVIRNNYVKDGGGDAITLMCCDRPLIEYNVSDGSIQDRLIQKTIMRPDLDELVTGIWPLEM
ncbi:MAG: hypothetical protein ACLTKE_09765 [Coprococcus sp.]